MIYVNHDTKNAEAKNIPHSRNLLLFYFNANAQEAEAAKVLVLASV